MDNNELMNIVSEILDGKQELPTKVTNKLLGGMIMHSHNRISENAKLAKGNEKRIIRLEVLLGSGGLLGGIAALLKQIGFL